MVPGRNTGNRWSEITAICLFSSGLRRVSKSHPVTARLQPQMKKYRSLWWMSTGNHNILYLAYIRRIRFLNTGICLWKAQNGLALRGFQGLILP
jgi:hypothetical protein